MIGEQLGAYAIQAELGSGGMGRVYRATGPDGVVALKVVHPHLLETPGFFKRFLREAEIGQTVRHENVVQTLDCDQVVSGGVTNAFLVMEYVEGQTLRDLLEELERVPEELCRHIGREVCKGLAAIHAANVIHRDIKPDNVLITGDHTVKIMDLGVARLQDEALRLSQTGAFSGSIHYAAPESFRDGGKNVDGRADLHSLGLVLYELACGTNPYQAEDVPRILDRVLNGEPRRLGDVNQQLSAFFEEVVHTLLRKDPGDRFASASGLLDVLTSGEDSPWWHDHARQVQAATKRPIRRIRIPRETAVYGRDDELAQLRELYDKAKAGDGQVVFIEGEAGIGKSRLVDELVARIQAEGDNLNFLFGSYPPGGAATAEGGFSSAFREHFGEEGSAAWLPENQVLVPAFDALLRGEGAPEGAQALTPGSLHTCFVRATETLAQERVTVLLIDDLHFSPQEGRALFLSLALAAPGHRVLLIGTTRPGVPEEWRAGLTRLAQTTQIPVQRLGPKDLVALLSDSFGSARLAEELAGKIAVKSDGNPFFAFEIIRGLREGQFLTQEDDGTWVSTQVIEDIQIPSSVLDLVNARVADLTQEERDLLDVACCWGYEFDPGLVADVVGEPLLQTLKRFATIEKRHRLVRASGRRLVFDHHQVQEALYVALYEQMREAYHAALADALAARTKAADKEPEALDGTLCVDLCEHYFKGARSEDALRYLAAAQTHLTKGYQHALVVSLTERALAVPGLLTDAERAQAHLKMVRAFDPMGQRERQEECAHEAERLAEEMGDDELRHQAARALGTLFYRTARHEKAEAAFRRSLELAVALGDRDAEAGATVNIGVAFHLAGRMHEAQEQLERGLALCREVGHRQFEASALVSLGFLFRSLGRLEEAQEHYEQGLEIFREIGDRSGESLTMGNLGDVLWARGRLREARDHYQECLKQSREIGDRFREADATGGLGVVFELEGRLCESLEYLERRLVLSREIGDRSGEANATGSVGIVFRGQGRLREAREHTERCLALSREIGYRHGECVALHNMGIVLREEGESASAEEYLLESLLLLEELGDRGLTADTHLVLGSLRAAACLSSGGDAAAARESLHAARDLAADLGRAGTETLARCELACLPGGEASDALSALAEHEEQLGAEHRREARWLLWRATGERAHLEEAKRLLDKRLENVPEDYRQAMRRNLRVNREIMDAVGS